VKEFLKLNLLLKYIFGLCLLLVLFSSVEAGSKIITINNDDSGCRNYHRYMYFSNNNSAKTYFVRNTSEYINNVSNLTTRPYKIWVKYKYKLNSCSEDGVDSSPYLSISRCNKNGNKISGTTTKININDGDSITNYIDINPNQGLLFDFYTGKWWEWEHHLWGPEHDTSAYKGYVEITYQLDETAPNTPKAPRVIGGYINGDICYVKYNENMQIVLEWDTVSDRGTSFGGYTIISEISHYNIFSIQGDIIKSEVKPSGQNVVSSLLNGGDFPEGQEIGVKIQAVDNENNQSDPGPILKIIADNTSPQGPTNLTTPNTNNCTNADPVVWTWKEATDDISGIQQYHIAIKEKETGVIFKEDIVPADTTSYSCSGLIDQKTYECSVTAEDYAGNLGEPASHTVKIIRTVPAVTLPEYPIKLDNGTLTFTWNPISLDDLGLKEYEVAVTESDNPPVAAQDSTTGNTYTNGKYSSRETWYAWVRAVDVLNNRGDWTMAGPFPGFVLTGPEDGWITNKKNHTINVTPRNGQELKYKAKYQTGGQGFETDTVPSGPLNIEFPFEAEWQWWLEVSEYQNGTEISATKVITEGYTLKLDQTDPTGFLTVKSTDGERICTETEPANEQGTILTDLQLNDQYGVKGITFWNGMETTPSNDAIYYEFDEISSAGIPWELPDLDGVHQINMLVEDNAGNTTLVSAAVALDRIAPGAPQNITHSFTNGVMTFKWLPGEPNSDISGYRGVYILPDGTETPFNVTPSETKEGQYQINTGLNANQAVIFKVCSVDRATNQSEIVEHLGCTPAEPGVLEYLGTGYDTAGNKHYLTWKLAEPGIAENHVLEYGQIVGEEFTPIRAITPNADGTFIHNSTGPNPEDKLQPHATYKYRLAALNKAGDKTYEEPFDQEVENLAPVKPEISEFAPAGYASGKVIFDYPETKDYDNDALTYAVKWAEGTNLPPGAYQKADWDEELGKYTVNLDPGKHGNTYSWYLEIKDSYGAVTDTSDDAVEFILDVNNPTIALEKPKSLYTNMTQIQVSVKDDLSGIKSLVYQVGNQEPRTVQLTSGNDGEKIGTIPLIEGQYNLKVTVQDQAGNSANEDVNNLWVDHTLPTLESASIGIDLPAKNGVYLTSGKIPTTWKAADDSSGIAGIRYWILKNGDQPGPGKYISLSSGLTEYSHNLELAPDQINGQTYYLSLAVLDKAGNSSATYRLPQGFLLDTTPPEVELVLTGLHPSGSSLYLTDLKNLEAALTIREEESDATASFNLIDSAAETTVTEWGQWKKVKKAELTSGRKYRVAAKAANGVGLETEILSEEFTFDNTAPVISKLTGPEQALIGGETFILAVDATEPETGIVKYRIAIGVEAGETEFSRMLPGNINGWYEVNTNSLQPQIRLETPEIADGVYHITLEAVNAAGLTTRYNGNPTLTVNNHQERIIVTDQGPYSMFADKLNGWWRYTGTKPVTGYRFRIIDQNDRIIRDWENTGTTTATLDQLQLENQNTYRFEVKAYFSDGTNSESGFSPGVTVDTTAPVINELKTALYTTPNDFGFDWAGDDDCSGISQVFVAVGTDYNQTDVTKGWVQVNGNKVILTRDANGEPLSFDLDHTNRYYLTLRLVNGSGLTAEKAAPAVVVDNTPPPIPIVYDQGGFINTKPEQPLEAHWFWSEADPESGCSYQWTILKYGEKVNEATQWNDGDATKRISLTMDDFSREHGETYYIAVKATNGAGLTSIGYSDGIMADATAPYLVKVKVLDAVNQNGDEEINYLTDKNKALRLWIDSYDPDSDIAQYLYAWNIPEEVDQTERQTSTEEPISIDNPELVEGAINIFLGETVNQAEITSPSGYSTGIVVDDGAPLIKNVRAGVSGNNLLFDWDAETSISPVVRYEYAFVSESKVNSITEEDWKTAEDMSLNRRLSLDATAYQDGRYCLVVRGYNAAGTYSRNDGEHHEWGISNVITLDRTAPEITTVVFPKCADESLKFSVSAMDEGSGIGGYQYTLGTAINPFQFSGGWIDLNTQESTVNIETPTDGISHNTGVYAMVRVRDQVALWSEAKVSAKIVIDHTEPEKPSLTYSSYATNKLLLTGIQYQAADPESGLVNYRLALVTEMGGTWLVTKEDQIPTTPEGNPAQLNLAIAEPGLTEAGIYYLALQVQNGTGDWSEIGYSGLITVDTIQPVLAFTQAGETLVINRPPLNIEYTLTEDAQVKFTVTGADGNAKEETVAGVTGVNQYVFTEAKPQIYTVTTIVTDKAGNVGETTEATLQTVRVNTPPFVVLPSEIVVPVGKTITMKAQVSDADGNEGDSFSYEWRPGDGGPVLNGAEPEYRYMVLGEYILSLAVTDKDGGRTTITAIIKVENTTGGSLFIDETWSGSHRIYGDVIVPEGIKLTIQPGTEIIIDGVPDETGYDHALIVRGTLNAGAGTKFTSVTGTAGGWQGILVEGEANLEEASIGYAERGVAALDDAKVSLEGCVFEYNLAGVHAYKANPEISSCVFRHNVYGIKEDESGRPVTKDCRFSGNGVDYYHLEMTEIGMEQLNGMPGNAGNVKE